MRRVWLLGLAMVSLHLASAATWQWSVETGVQRGRAFLWIPEDCTRVRGVVLGQQVILEERFLQDPRIRAACARAGLAQVLLCPMCLGYDDFDVKAKGADLLAKILGDLAAVSGYDELANAPLLPIGHSGGGIVPWMLAYRWPQRTIAVCTIKCAALRPPAYAPRQSVDGVPTLSVSGQYESWGDATRSAEHHWRWLRGDLLSFRGFGRCPLNSELVEPGVTHFGWDESLAGYLGMFIERAAAARCPDTPGPCREVALESGWLTDPTFMTPSRYPPAPYRDYQGDPTLAMWHLDGDLARANDAYRADQRGKRLQLVTFISDGRPLPPAWIQDVKFAPAADGVTVQVRADWVTETPPELSFPVKRTLGHAPGPLRFKLIGGWTGGGEQVGPDTFRLRTDQLGLVRPVDNLMVMAYHPGDAEYAACEQACQLKFPGRNVAGAPQTLTFAPLADVPVGTASVPLLASADSGLPVEFTVLHGPAAVEAGRLRLLPLPPRARLPLQVTVAAGQWGRSLEPRVRSAATVMQSFNIVAR